MQLGLTLPVMEPDLWERGASTLEAWARAVDEGPWASLCFGERMAFDNPETLTLLGAVAAWTSRVRLVTTVVVPQLHDPVLLAKALATGDQLSAGRLVVGLGVGGRGEDYRAVGADLADRTVAGLDDRVATMRSVWRGEHDAGAVRRVGPPPAQAGGPPLLVGALGPRTIRHAAAWADGLAGVTLDLDVAAVGRTFDLCREAWAAQERPAPRLTTSFWCALEEDGHPGGARAQLHRHLRHYMNWLPVDLVDAMAPTTGFAGTAAELEAVLGALADVGADEVHLIPVASGVEQVHRLAQVAGRVADRVSSGGVV
ncbi:LLM class flavin-dependent oxidoreductase [Nocardioides litoris]|uniref:LLM class flavin-dependent oxidoreductase n=1 Tax=Nocardioides litoris TaxID=1926648 RepID=UPI001B862772|nr:LLM class flavin-dependent oxidoreductase [Nocardioides litoris]